jgi:hypothetical protein
VHLAIDPDAAPDRYDRARCPEMKERFAAMTRTRTRASGVVA